jgi:hypothetical protein
MTERHQRKKNRQPQQPVQPADPHGPRTADHPVEEDPAVERGERIDTGKTIARGGKETGHVPGATEELPKRRQKKPSP